MLHHVTDVVDSTLAWASSAAPGDTPNTQGLADWLRTFLGPIFLAIVSIAMAAAKALGVDTDQ